MTISSHRRIAAAVGLIAIITPWCSGRANAQEPTNRTALATSFEQRVRPLLDRYCIECHAGENAEAEIDLVAPASMAEVQAHPELWQKVREMLGTRQMPPADSQQIPEADYQQLTNWVRNWLKLEAQARAGDPGPVVLRRLSNAEYDYSIEELTNVPALNPTRQFPVDGASGEGFTNTGSAQGMSPALVSKYLDAAKDVARHAVLLPDGIRFSPFQTRRDHTDEILASIQAFYRQFTADGGGTAVDLQGIQFETNQGGRLPINRYLQATIAERDSLSQGQKTIEQVAAAHGLSPKYLERIWQIFHHETNNAGTDLESVFIAGIRSQWKSAKVDDVAAISEQIENRQRSLWKFNPVGQIGRDGGPDAWMEPISPLVAQQELKYLFPTDLDDDPVLVLTAHDLGAAHSETVVQWHRPRLEFSDGRPPLLLKDIGSVANQVKSTIATEARLTEEYLDAMIALRQSTDSIETIATARDLNPLYLAAWADLLDLGPAGRKINGHLLEPITQAGGYEEVNGWGKANTPSFLTNRSHETISFSTLMLPPRSVFVHPSPELESLITWQSSIAAVVKVQGIVADADSNCGNGVHWSVQHRNERGTTILEQGVIGNGNRQEIVLENEIPVRIGDLVSLVVNSRDQSHVCDTTLIDLTITEVKGKNRVWNLTKDVVDCVRDGNPVTDAHGNQRTWHFCAEPSDLGDSSKIPAGSLLAHWRRGVVDSAPGAELTRLAMSIQNLITSPAAKDLAPADRNLRKMLLDWKGPLRWLDGTEPETPAAHCEYGLQPTLFGNTPGGIAIENENLCLRAPQVLEFRLPRQLAAGAVFVTHGSLYPAPAADARAVGGCVQFQVLTKKPNQLSTNWSLPVVANPGPSRAKLEIAMQQFRDSFPIALCYSRIVPVDEVVTLTLYHRDDDHLKRLMLNHEQSVELDRLWEQLYFVSREPILLTNVFEQISEFATQDRPDLVTAFAPMRKPIYDRAEQFRSELIDAEPNHVQAVTEFARLAWRRPLEERETQKIQELYQNLRAAELPHEKAIRLMLARVLTSPAFLYKLEKVQPGSRATPVSDLELATRLSYFLWSSPPDQELRTIAESGKLNGIDLVADRAKPNSEGKSPYAVLRLQTRRMQQDPRTRRLAVHFACQWLHVRDFDQNNDKNEKVFPEFLTLRKEMYEETVLFFEDMFRNDGSVLDLIAGEHTFVNEVLARHYGFENTTGSDWQKVEGVRNSGRGGVLGMAAILASQSGASRTSPILRGTWVSETLLGERLPRPPANIPQLPERVPSGLTARELIEHHTRRPECAKCHLRIDPYGFALEQFDAMGRIRTEKTDTKAVLVDGTRIDGLAGLIDYLSTKRRDDLVRQFCRKLLGYALGREVILSDEPLLDEMQLRLKNDNYRFGVALETIVTSPQFLNIRGTAFDQ